MLDEKGCNKILALFEGFPCLHSHFVTITFFFLKLIKKKLCGLKGLKNKKKCTLRRIHKFLTLFRILKPFTFVSTLFVKIGQIFFFWVLWIYDFDIDWRIAQGLFFYGLAKPFHSIKIDAFNSQFRTFSDCVLRELVSDCYKNMR